MVSDFINEKETEKSESFFHTDYQIGGKWYNIRIFRLETEVNFRGYVFFFIDNTENVINQQRIKNLNNKYHEDLKLASNMQINLAKNKAVHNPYVNFKCIYRPSGMIGGDFYYVDQINVGKQDFTFAFISDVSGHGIRASILTVLIKDVFNEFKSKVRRPNEVKSSLFLEKLNNKITELNIYPFMYIGVFAVVINHSTLKMNYSSAGAPPALIIRRNKLLEFCIPHQPSIGTEDSYEFKEEIQQMEYGDRIILYTDGIMGLFDTTDEQDLSKENQMDFIRNMIRLPIYKMHEEYENFIKEKISEYEEERKETDKIDEVDDITILFIELKKTKSTIQSMGNFLNINKKKYHS